MLTFKVLVHGRGIVVRHWWVLRRRYNFYATRFVDAETSDEARTRAIASVRGEPRLAMAAIRAPALGVEEIEIVEGPASAWPQIGIVFYRAGAEENTEN